jgi:hypothetical protein
MTATCKEHSPATLVDTRQRCGGKKPEIPMFSMTKRFMCCSRSSRGSQLGHHRGIDSICNQRRAYVMTRYVANKRIQMIFAAGHSKSKISPDRANGVKMRFDTHATPDEALWCEAFLDTGRERQLLFHLLLPLFQLLVRFAKLLLGSLLFGNLRKCDYAESAFCRNCTIRLRTLSARSATSPRPSISRSIAPPPWAA